jgi:ABC-type lipoprotein release transport system permease subunit
MAQFSPVRYTAVPKDWTNYERLMRIIDFVTKESFRRKKKSIVGILFILLGISIFVACQTISKSLHDRVKEQLLRFGANIVVQPKAQPFDLYSGTTKGEILLSEDYVDKIESIASCLSVLRSKARVCWWLALILMKERPSPGG